MFRTVETSNIISVRAYGWSNNNHRTRNHPNMNRGHPPPPNPSSSGGQSYFWVNSSRGQHVPTNAVVCGKDRDGSDIYVGLTNYAGDEMPAKIIPNRREAYISYDGKEIPVSDYKVLAERKLLWIHNVGGRIPPGAVPAGRTSTGETLYVGRRNVEKNIVAVGKVHPSHGCVYIPYGGNELSFKDYEILVHQ